ncbi:MAG: hypothetical protein GX447_09010 [Elusimicrobia bacterium]|nr:hypothetical protein [Elusimicrobiota bacterium]
MKKSVFAFILFLSACAKQDYDISKAALALINHSYYPISQQEAKNLSQDISKIKEIDPNAGLVSYKSLKTDKPIKRELYYPVIFSWEKEKIYAAKVFDFSIAYESGLRSGCEIITIAGVPARQAAAEPEKILSLMKKGESFMCEYSCGDSKKSSVEIKKELAYFPFVWNISLSSQTAYVKINNFSPSSSKFVKNNISNLKSSGKKNLILDLRSVSGGDYAEAADFINLFSPKDSLLFEVKSDKEGYRKKFTAQKEPSFTGFNIAVLINSKTASLGEIAAASLKKNAGAYLIGEKTAGKFFITKIFKTGDKNGLRLTVAKLSLSGEDLSEGFSPDIYFKDALEGKDIFNAPFSVQEDILIIEAAKSLSSNK